VDPLEFIAALVSSLAWPLAIVVVVLLLRHQIRNLIPLLRRVRYGEFEAEFSEEVEETAEVIEQRVEETPVKELPSEVEERLRRLTDRMRKRARVSPDRAVIDAWSLVASEIQEAAIRNDVDLSLGVTRILKTLADRERIPEWVVDAVRDLRRMRSEADFWGPLPTLPTQAAIDYINSVEQLAKFLARA
jgi:hypothetical protein